MFDECHTEVARWFTEALVDGVRIDHPDGLADPAGYLVSFAGGRPAGMDRDREDPGRRRTPGSQPSVNGTTGYDVLRDVGGVFIDRPASGR